MKKLMILILVVGLMSGGCKKYLNVNQNPNQPTTVPPNSVLSSALAGTASNMGQDFQNLNRWMAYWSRSGNYVPDVQTETYNIPNNYTDFEWGNIYNTLNSYDYIEKAGRAGKLPFYVAVGKVMKAFHFSTLVDIYNNVPYSQAFNVTGAVQPKYDNGQDIYNDLIKQIDSAIILFDSSKTIYSTAAVVTLKTDDQYDIMFGHSGLSDKPTALARMDAWVRFANTLELKLLMHQSQVSGQQALITAELAKIAANARGFIGAGQSAKVNPGYTNSTNKINPFFATFFTVTTSTTNVAYYRANTYAINFYNNNNDPRIAGFYAPVGTAFAGNYDGDPAAVTNSFSSAIGPGLLKGPAQDQLILSDFESLFLQAEAVQRGWITGNAQALYQSAITQSFEYVYKDGTNTIPAGLTPDADAQAYYTQGLPDVDWTASTDKIHAILTQKWAALNGINQVEAWTDFRRTGIPALPISKAPTHIQPQIPVRYLYPQSELNTNGANVPQLGANAQFTAKIFWNQ
jgi:hypothetical protein